MKTYGVENGQEGNTAKKKDIPEGAVPAADELAAAQLGKNALHVPQRKRRPSFDFPRVYGYSPQG
jgi:hypothetical protein